MSQQEARHQTKPRITKYSRKLDLFDRAAVRKYAAHVAAWIAYGPHGHIPSFDELQLFRRFLDKLGGGLLPLRLQQVLPFVQAVLTAIPKDEANPAWKKVEQQLQHRLRNFRCCRHSDVDVDACPAMKLDIARDLSAVNPDAARDDVESRLAEVRFAAPCADRASGSECLGELQLFRAMNKWGLLDSSQKLECLEHAEQTFRCLRKNMNEERLAEVITLAAAALSPLRGHGTQVETEGSTEQRALQQPDSHQADLQRRVRLLLLAALRAWRANQFDARVIEHILEYVQVKLEKFESMGKIHSPTAGAVWVSIQDAVKEIRRVEGTMQVVQSTSRARRAASDTRMRQLERQSGVQNIGWNSSNMNWQLSVQEAGKQKRIYFPIASLLKQGLGEEAAIDAALQNAKAKREELVQKGKLPPAKPVIAKSSLVRGVWFDKARQKWAVHFTDPTTKKKIHFGRFETKQEAEAKARKMARKFGLQAETELVPATKVSELPRFEPLEPQKGVHWLLSKQCWRAARSVGGKRTHRNFRPKDVSEQEVAKAWKEAVAWRQQCAE